MATTTNRNITKLAAKQNNPESTLNTALDNLDARDGKLVLTLTGGTYALSATEGQVGLVVITGTLTASQTVNLPAGGSATRLLVIDNRTSGSYTLTVKVNGAGTGVVVLQGTRALLVHDGTEVYLAGYFVSKLGDTMTGDLTIQKATPLLILNNTDNTQVLRVRFQENGTTNGDFQMVGSNHSSGSEQNWMEFVNRTATGGINFWTNTTERLALTPGGAIKLPAYSSLPGSYDADSIYLYVEGTNAELKVRDELGNVTTLSPHAEDAPAWLYDPADTCPPHMTVECNVYAGTVRFTNHTRLTRLQQAQFLGAELPADAERRKVIHEETFADYNARLGLAAGDAGLLVVEDWDANQEACRLKREVERATWLELEAAHRNWARLPADERARTPTPEPPRGALPPPYEKKPKPAWLRNVAGGEPKEKVKL